jgi:hypothetical protein
MKQSFMRNFFESETDLDGLVCTMEMKIKWKLKKIIQVEMSNKDKELEIFIFSAICWEQVIETVKIFKVAIETKRKIIVIETKRKIKFYFFSIALYSTVMIFVLMSINGKI